MQINPGLMKRWRYVARVMAPVIASLGVLMIALLGYILWSIQRIDAQSLEQQTALVRRAIDTQIARLPHEQESATIWDDAVINVKLMPKLAWIDAKLGIRLAGYFGHDEVIVVNDKDQAVYAMNNGARVENATVSRELGEIAPMISALRAKIANGDLAAFAAGTVDHPPSVADLAVFDGIPSIVSVAPIISDTGTLPQVPGTEYLHISAVHLDATYARALSDQYLITAPSFSPPARDTLDRVALPLTNSSGRIVTFFGWTPNRPGQALFNQTVPFLSGAYLLAGIVVFVLLDMLWRKSEALEAGRARAEHQAAHDRLTGLPNRVNFETALAWAASQRNTFDRRTSLLMLDLDRFKQVNDTLGHRAGDDLIQAVAQRLRHIVQPTDFLGRLGGDEFAIILNHPPGPRAVQHLTRQVIEALGKPFEIAGSEVFIGVSIGIATADGEDEDARELARKADIALYEAKATGRNRAVFFEQAMSELLQSRHVIEAELREALKRDNQLSVAFQPLFGPDHTRIVGAEALARWSHPRLGQVSPAHFIPVAEATGLVEALGEFVLRRACELGARWPGMTIAVNVSPAQLRNPGFTQRVFDILSETGMRPSDLEIEITEGILLEEASVAVEALHLFRSSGIQIALDDFGTGYSSLNYLKRYPVDRIKIDRSFVSQLARGDVSVAIVNAMVSLAHALRIDVTAEGVETKAQVDVLTGLGCNIFQGFLLSPPVDSEAIEKQFALWPPPRPKSAARVA